MGGVLWGLLLPPSLPSPLPSPGRGMRDLEGLSTEVPLGSEAAPQGTVTAVPLLDLTVFSFLTCLFNPFYLFIDLFIASIACLHAPQCVCLSSAT